MSHALQILDIKSYTLFATPSVGYFISCFPFNRGSAVHASGRLSCCHPSILSNSFKATKGMDTSFLQQKAQYMRSLVVKNDPEVAYDSTTGALSKIGRANIAKETLN